MNSYNKPLPRPDDSANAPHWAGAVAGELKFQRCAQCRRFRFPAAPICPHCRSREAQWETAPPQGVVESYCRFHKAYWPGFADDLPYLVIQVLLDCGVRMYSNLVEVPDTQVRIGMRVEAVFVSVTQEVKLVKFKALDSSASGHTRLSLQAEAN
jgi:hypothetical protein